MKNLKSVWRMIALGALVASVLIFAAVWAAQRVQAQASGPMPPMPVFPQGSSFGMVGIVRGQTARLNIVNPAGPRNIPQFPCRLELAFLDSQGQNLKKSTIDNLDPGKAAFLDLGWSEIADAQDNRVEVRATVGTFLPTPLPLATGASFPQRVSCSVIPSLEVFDDDTGRTTLILSGGPTVPTSMPLPILATGSSQ